MYLDTALEVKICESELGEFSGKFAEFSSIVLLILRKTVPCRDATVSTYSLEDVVVALLITHLRMLSLLFSLLT